MSVSSPVPGPDAGLPTEAVVTADTAEGSPRPPLGWGLIGTGGICGHLAWALSHVPQAKMVAVGSRGLDRAEAFVAAHRERHPHARALGSYEALVQDPAVDVVYIGTPHPDHLPSVRLALAAGKAVLCEKPFTVNAAQAREAVALAQAKDVFLMEAMWTRYLPAAVELKRRLAQGVIGEVVGFSADFGFAADFGPEHRTFNPVLAGGALLDVGIYPLSLAAWLLGPVSDVQAMATLGPTGVDVHTQFNLRHAGGALSQGQCSLQAGSPCTATVLGTRGRIELLSPFYGVQAFRVVRSGEPDELVERPWRGNGFVPQVEEVHRCLGAGLRQSPDMPWAESVALVEVMDRIRAQVGLRYPFE